MTQSVMMRGEVEGGQTDRQTYSQTGRKKSGGEKKKRRRSPCGTPVMCEAGLILVEGQRVLSGSALPAAAQYFVLCNLGEQDLPVLISPL